MEELMQRIDALQRRAIEGDKLIGTLRRRVDQLETQQHMKSQTAAAHRENAVLTAGQTPQLVPAALQLQPPISVSAAVSPQPSTTAIPGLRPPEPMGSQYSGEGQDALRSDLPGLSLRIPGAQSEVRLYGFANVTGYRDFNGRNQTDLPTVQTIPLSRSPADLQGGDFGLSARFSRIGIDTRTAIPWGTLETRFEGDFGGGAPTSTNAAFRLRQAWAEFGSDRFRVLVGQANSLWNEGVYENVNFAATNLNQSFVRQPQVRVISTLAPGLTGQVSLEMPDTQYTSVAGVFTQGATPTGFTGLSPSFASVPDLLGRLEYRDNGLVLDVRTLLRDLTIHTNGTVVAPSLTRNAAGWGVAGTARFPMRWVSNAFGPDELIGMTYYGQGIGRYFGGNTFGQDALSNIGLPGTTTDVTLDALATYGVTGAYRHFWTPQVRSNVVYSYAWQQYPSYALFFVPGSASATSLNSDMQQAIVNLIWSPFAQLNGNTVATGSLDFGLEYVYSHRNVFGGSVATLPTGVGFATANRILSSVTVRF